MMLMMLLMTTMALTLITLKHPLSLGFALIMQITMTSLMTSLIYSSWYSYILFLIMIGGLMILFLYMTSISSNSKFKFSWKVTMIWMLTMPMYMILNKINTQTLDLFNPEKSFIPFFSLPNTPIMMMMMIYLFMTLIIVVKITMINYGILRKK